MNNSIEASNALTTMIYMNERIFADKNLNVRYTGFNMSNLKEGCKFIYKVLGISTVNEILLEPYRRYFLYMCDVKGYTSVDLINMKALNSLASQSLLILLTRYLKLGYDIKEIENKLNFEFPDEASIINSFYSFYRRKIETTEKEIKNRVLPEDYIQRLVKICDEYNGKSNLEVCEDFIKKGYNETVITKEYQKSAEFITFNNSVNEVINKINSLKGEEKKIEAAKIKLGKKLRARYRYRKDFFAGIGRDKFNIFMDCFNTVKCQDKNFNIVLSQFNYDNKAFVNYDELIKVFITYFDKETLASLTAKVKKTIADQERKQTEYSRDFDLTSNISNLM